VVQRQEVQPLGAFRARVGQLIGLGSEDRGSIADDAGDADRRHGLPAGQCLVGREAEDLVGDLVRHPRHRLRFNVVLFDRGHSADDHAIGTGRRAGARPQLSAAGRDW